MRLRGAIRGGSAGTVLLLAVGWGVLPASVGATAAAAAAPAPPYDVLTLDGERSSTTFTHEAPTGVSLWQDGRTVRVAGWATYPNGTVRQQVDVAVAPPILEDRLVAGRSYDASRFGDETHGSLYLSVDSWACGQSGGSFTVRDVAYGETAEPTALALSYDFHCLDGAGTHVLGEIRWRSEVPYPAVEVADVAAGTVTVEQTVDQVATYRNTGSEPVTVAGVSVGGSNAADWRITSTDCIRVVAPGELCTAALSVTPTEVGDRSATLTFTDDTPRGTHARRLVVDAAGVSAPADFRAVPLLGRTVLAWAPGPGRAPAGYLVRRGTDRFALYAYKQLPSGSTTWTDDDWSVAWTTYIYTVEAIPDGAGQDAATNQIAVPPTDRELVMVGAGELDARPVLRAGSLVTGTSVVDDGSAAVTSPPSLSPAGTELAYGTGSGASAEVWLGLTRSPTQPSCESCISGFHATDPAWSPRSRELALVSPTGTLLRYDLTTRTVSTVTGITRAAQPSWLPDGSGLVVVDTAAGAPLRRVALTGASAAITGTAGGRRPAVSPRLDRLAFLLPWEGQQALAMVPLAGAASPQLLLTGDLRHVAWTGDGSAVLVTRGADAGSEVVTVDPSNGFVTPLFRSTTRLESAVLRKADTQAPQITISAPALTSGRATIPFTVVDDTMPVGALTITCSLDGAAPTACGPTSWSGTVATGTRTLAVTASDGYRFAVRKMTWYADATAPTARMTAPPAATVLASSVTIGWAGGDTGSGVASYDVRFRWVSDRSTGWSAYSYPAAWQRTTRTAQLMYLREGTEYCVSVRARDKAGNVGAWSAARCFARPLDDRSLAAATSGWTRGTSSAHYAGTWTGTRAYGARLVRTSAHAKRVVLVVTTCSTCGKVEVWIGSTKIGTVSTYSSTTHYRAQRTLPVQSYVRAGTLTVKSVTSRRPLYVDAVVLRRT